MKLIAAAVLAFSFSVSHADSRSWTAVKGMLPDTTSSVMGANVTTLRGTSLYAQVVPLLLAREPDAKKALEMTKAACSIDLRDSIVDATFAMGADDRGVIVLALDKSLDQKKVADCMQKVIDADAKKAAAAADLKAEAAKGNSGGLKSAGKKATEKDAPVAKDAPATPAAPVVKAPPPKLVAKTTGKITEYGLDNSSDRFYVAWLAGDVVAIATDPDDKALLEKMLAGKGTKGEITKLLGKTGSNAAVWLAATKATPLPTGHTMKAVFGTVQAGKGNVDVDANMVMSNAKEAKAFVDQATQLIASAKDGVPPQFKKLIDALKLSAKDDSTVLKFSAAEKDISSLIAIAMMNL